MEEVKKKKHFKILTFSAAVLGIIIVLAAVALLLYSNGIITLNNPTEYEVRGVDVSSYQGKIDWNVLSKNIDFAYIKATEGSGSVDPKFADNWSNAQNNNIRIGAYHFFSFDSGGKTQAENFISNVEAVPDMLPPAIDVEFYGDKEKNPPSREEVDEQLDILISELETHYGIKPVIYSTRKAYEMYISGSYKDCDIWIRDILTKPSLSDRDGWTFWQYSEKGQLDGYSGDEKFIDMNVFNGTKKEFKYYAESSENNVEKSR
ncbi:MAG: glycoside hydrolase family 25 protein [Clostridia bacterium]|nr:glycoside hydrolase family 25 protein [Clostridia bacterium]